MVGRKNIIQQLVGGKKGYSKNLPYSIEFQIPLVIRCFLISEILKCEKMCICKWLKWGLLGPAECDAPMGPCEATGTQGPELRSEACGRNSDKSATSMWQPKPREHVA